jgi:hypothetical protein
MINLWLQKFTNSWKSQNIDSVLELFTPTVNYWETPFKKLDSLDVIKKEWQVVKLQQNIDIQTSPVLSENNNHTVKWNLKYLLEGKPYNWSGLYIVKLDEDGFCNYFYQVGEEEK